jgi:hypothetical protein
VFIVRCWATSSVPVNSLARRQFQLRRVPSAEVPDEDGESDNSSRQGEVIAAEPREFKLGVQKNTRGQPVKN